MGRFKRRKPGDDESKEPEQGEVRDDHPTDQEFAEYLRYLRTPHRLIFVNFAAGLARGLGMSVGFTILGALLVYFMRQLVWSNIPWLSQFIAEIVVLVDAKT